MRAPQSFSIKDKRAIVQKDIDAIEKIKTSHDNYRSDVPIDLYTAIALAIKNNKNLKSKILETAVVDQKRKNIKFDMLPGLAANAGYSGMKKYDATNSATITGDVAGTPGSTYSSSKEKDVTDQRVGFSWNALDFGLSYIRAGQEGDRYLIAKELERKTAHNITRDVIRAYWKTYHAQELLKEYDNLIVDVKKALNDSKTIEELLLQKPMDALRYQKELLDIQTALQAQRQILVNAQIELGSLMGLLPSEKFTVVETKLPLTSLNMEIKEMEEYALLNRPEVNEKHYQERISLEETKASMRALLPGVSLTANFTNSSNTYLKNRSNVDYGSSIGGNLLNVFKAPSVKRFGRKNTEVLREQRLAVAMTVVSQVHLAQIDYEMSTEELETAQKYLDVSEKITKQVSQAQKIARFGNLELIREKASYLVAKLKYGLAYAEMQHSIGKLYSSLGIDVTEVNVKKISYDTNLNQFAQAIQNNFKKHSVEYRAVVKNPIQNQDPVVKNSKFSFDEDTFELQGKGDVRYRASLENNDPLPNWLVFLPSKKTFYVRKDIKGNIEDIKVKVTAKNIYSEAEDQFVLLVDPKLRAERLAKEKKALALKEQKEKKVVKKVEKIEEKKKVVKVTEKKEVKKDNKPVVSATLRQETDEDQSPYLLMKKTIDQKPKAKAPIEKMNVYIDKDRKDLTNEKAPVPKVVVMNKKTNVVKKVVKNSKNPCGVSSIADVDPDFETALKLLDKESYKTYVSSWCGAITHLQN